MLQPRAPQDITGLLLKLSFFVFLVIAGSFIFGWAFSFAGILAASAVGTFAAAVTANAIAVRTFEHVSVTAIGLGWSHGSARNLFLGIAGAAVFALFVTVVPATLRLAYFAPAGGESGSVASAIFLSVMLFLGAAGEEMLFRGYLFQLLLARFGSWPTITVTSILFGLVHVSNQNVSPLALVNTLAFGVILGYSVLRSRDLWLATGIHFGWNWVLPLAGVSLSGFKMGVTGYELRWRIPDLWSGGEYGPEGGILCWGAIAGLAVFLRKAPFVPQPVVQTGPEPVEEAPQPPEEA
jgi:membrane protease YdiL (CAAX protease family)